MAEYKLKTGTVGEKVVSGYKSIENGVVDGYKKIEKKFKRKLVRNTKVLECKISCF